VSQVEDDLAADEEERLEWRLALHEELRRAGVDEALGQIGLHSHNFIETQQRLLVGIRDESGGANDALLADFGEAEAEADADATDVLEWMHALDQAHAFEHTINVKWVPALCVVEADRTSASARYQRVLLKRAVVETQDREQLIALVRDFVSQRAGDEREGEKLFESRGRRSGVENDSELGRLASRLQGELEEVEGDHSYAIERAALGMLTRLTKAVRVGKMQLEEDGDGGVGGKKQLSVVIERMMLMAAGHVQIPTGEFSDEEEGYVGYGYAEEEEEEEYEEGDGLMGMETEEEYLQSWLTKGQGVVSSVGEE
jgi:hypothetical protein